MELTKEEKDEAINAYRSAWPMGKDVRLFATVSTVLEMRDRGHEVVQDDVSKDEQIAVLSSAFHDVLCDLHPDDATFQETKKRYLAEALAENKMIESLLPMFMEIAGMPALTPAAPETQTEPCIPAAAPRQLAEPLPKCSHPDCDIRLGLTVTDLGLLCGLHLEHAKDIFRGEERLIAAEEKLKSLTENANFLRKSVGACHMMISRNDLEELRQDEWDATHLPPRLYKFISELKGNLVALPDVEKAIRSTFHEHYWHGGVPEDDDFGEFVDYVRARLKPGYACGDRGIPFVDRLGRPNNGQEEK